MEKRGQGALEYLLLIGGAVLIAIIVIALVTGVANNTGGSAGGDANCVAQTGCTMCKVNSRCMGFSAGGTAIVGWTSGTACTGPESQTFGFCKAR